MSKLAMTLAAGALAICGFAVADEDDNCPPKTQLTDDNTNKLSSEETTKKDVAFWLEGDETETKVLLAQDDETSSEDEPSDNPSLIG